jgi:DNA replication protein DnaC
LGYMDMTKDSANLFFQLVSKRYERGSIILNTNRPFEEWGSLFQNIFYNCPSLKFEKYKKYSEVSKSWILFTIKVSATRLCRLKIRTHIRKTYK